MTTHPCPRETETRRLADLKDHPAQAAFFTDLDPAALAALVADIRRNGLREPLEVLPDGTILSGHQRRRALLKIGETEAPVVVRKDLAADPAAAERAFLEANANRRQLSKLDRARVVLRLVEIEKKRPRGRLRPDEAAEARDRVGATIGMTGRNLGRYFRLLATPAEVQQAFEAGAVPQVVAETVADLTPKDQAALAAALRAGGDAGALISAAVQANQVRADAGDPSAPVRKVVLWAARAAAVADRLPPHLVACYRPELERAAALLARLAKGDRIKNG
jgi:ParB-like chromosome segregation protein Spo0J